MGSGKLTVKKIKEKVTPILQDYNVSKAILFGSCAKGGAISSSDVDLYIDSNGELKGLDFVGLLEVLASALGTDVDLIDKSHIDSDSLIMREIEKEGIVIYEKSTI